MIILHTEWSDGWGGQERRIYTEMLGMRERGHTVILATRPQCELGKRLSAAGVEVVHFPFKGKFDFASIFAIKRLIQAKNVQIVNTHSGIDSWVGGIAAKFARVALIRTRHLNLPLHRHWLNFVHYLQDRVVTCGVAMQQKLIREHGFPPLDVVSIPTGVDFSSFKPDVSRDESRKMLNVEPNSWAVLMVAVLRHVKRHDVAFKAVALFSKDKPDTRLVLCGDGPKHQDLKAQAEQLGIAQQVIFLGHRDDVPDVMVGADALLLTSESEGIPQAVTQGLGCGLPVVATRVGGVPEIVRDGETGLLAASEDAHGIADALDRLYNNTAFAKKLGAQAANFAQQTLSLQAMLNDTEKLYAQVLRQRGEQ